jgi:hypothetical protein
MDMDLVAVAGDVNVGKNQPVLFAYERPRACTTEGRVYGNGPQRSAFFFIIIVV